MKNDLKTLSETEDTRWTKTIKGWSDHDILAHQFNSKFYSTSWINKTQWWLDISASHLMSYFASSSCGWWLYHEISNDTNHTKLFFFCFVQWNTLSFPVVGSLSSSTMSGHWLWLLCSPEKAREEPFVSPRTLSKNTSLRASLEHNSKH